VLLYYRNDQKIVDIVKNLSETDIYNMSKYIIDIFPKKYSKDACQNQYVNYYKNLLNLKSEILIV